MDIVTVHVKDSKDFGFVLYFKIYVELILMNLLVHKEVVILCYIQLIENQ